jgi:hypothetical protein
MHMFLKKHKERVPNLPGTKTKTKSICTRNWNMAAIVEGDEPLLGEIPSRCLLQMELTARNINEISMTGVA